MTNLSWWCTEFSNHSFHLQLNFTDPMEVSQDHQDQLVLTFTQPDLFVLLSRPEYLFSNESSKTLIFNIPI